MVNLSVCSRSLVINISINCQKKSKFIYRNEDIEEDNPNPETTENKERTDGGQESVLQATSTESTSLIRK